MCNQADPAAGEEDVHEQRGGRPSVVCTNTCRNGRGEYANELYKAYGDDANHLDE